MHVNCYKPGKAFYTPLCHHISSLSCRREEKQEDAINPFLHPSFPLLASMKNHSNVTPAPPLLSSFLVIHHLPVYIHLSTLP